MITRIFFFLLGFGLIIVGSMYIISYLNLLTIGYNFKDYVNFIIRRPECLNAILGIIILLLVIFIPRGEKNVYLWYFTKF